MEGSAFDAAAPAAPESDPFGENGEGDFRQGEDPFAEQEQTPAPRVDREGNPIEGDAPLASAEEEAELAAAQASAEEAGIDSATAVASSVAPEQEVVQPDPPSAPTDGAETASSAASSESTAQSADDLNGAQVPAEGSPAATTVDGSPAEAQDAGEDPAAQAEAPKAKKGLRAYRLFVPESNGKFAELSWLEDKAGKLVKPGTPGAKKQTVVLTREQDGALHHGFAVLGSPEGGAKLVAVADSQWTVRHVEPDPVQPVRQRLRIK